MIKNWNQMNKRQRKIAVDSTKNWVVTENDARPVSKVDWNV